MYVCIGTERDNKEKNRLKKKTKIPKNGLGCARPLASLPAAPWARADGARG